MSTHTCRSARGNIIATLDNRNAAQMLLDAIKAVPDDARAHVVTPPPQGMNTAYLDRDRDFFLAVLSEAPEVGPVFDPRQ